jgi:hypothetical protein
MSDGPYFDKRLNSNASKLIASSTTTELFTGAGVLMGAVIGVPVASGTFHFTNTAGDAIAGLPNATDPWGTDARGTYPFFNFSVSAGLKCVTTSADTISMAIFAYTP